MKLEYRNLIINDKKLENALEYKKPKLYKLYLILKIQLSIIFIY